MKLFLSTGPSHQDTITKRSRKLDREAPSEKLNLTDQVPAIYTVSKLFDAHRNSYHIYVLKYLFNSRLGGEQYQF